MFREPLGKRFLIKSRWQKKKKQTKHNKKNSAKVRFPAGTNWCCDPAENLTMNFWKISAVIFTYVCREAGGGYLDLQFI